MTYSVTFLPYNTQVDVEENQSLIRTAMEAGLTDDDGRRAVALLLAGAR